MPARREIALALGITLRKTRFIKHELRIVKNFGLAAFAADNSQDSELTKSTNNLSEIVANSFHALPREENSTKEPFFAGGPYDSPTGFDPHDKQLQQVLDKIRVRLTPP